MSEKSIPPFRYKAETIRRLTPSGMVIECQTTVEGKSGLAQTLSEERDKNLIVSPSVWHFIGPRHNQTALTIAKTLNMLIDKTPEAKGRYDALCVNGDSEIQTPTGTTVEPFAAVTITGRADQVGSDEVTAFSYQAMGKINELLETNKLGFQIPLPPEIR
ncbi:MAG TPA: hypothetical protein VJ836_03450 [Candidatus Saccharimonadales bacterium]|nr:hypothetical protein [Candidatus Saccharimonadales bacterium]